MTPGANKPNSPAEVGVFLCVLLSFPIPVVLIPLLPLELEEFLARQVLDRRVHY